MPKLEPVLFTRHLSVLNVNSFTRTAKSRTDPDSRRTPAGAIDGEWESLGKNRTFCCRLGRVLHRELHVNCGLPWVRVRASLSTRSGWRTSITFYALATASLK